ncbi:transposase [Streptosporangium subroseum]|uniref:IS66 family transposase n=1 Tax=Streptosporangium subroseum TaxID=106412 RepID=UPI003444AE1D
MARSDPLGSGRVEHPGQEGQGRRGARHRARAGADLPASLPSGGGGRAVGAPACSRRKQSPARNLLERLRDRAGDVLRFADHPGWVPFTNNEAERALRPVKTQVKISGCHQSEDGATARLTVRSYLDSARKHGLGAFEAIRRAFTGDLWMPPVALAD